ncbi:peptidoglycan-binding protein [Paracoccus litorisediminis]|uniref:peptidoglycan-binding domain-containing protein n=1 Tax=Paracoccus litorisediminis TaxID=2006130 RepID=UPI00372F8C64
MSQMKLKVAVGESRPSASASTFIGAMLDDKKSKRALQNAMFNAGARKHYRTKTAWICSGTECQKLGRQASVAQELSSSDVAVLLGIAAVVFLLVAGGIRFVAGSPPANEERASSASTTVASAEVAPEIADTRQAQAPSQTDDLPIEENALESPVIGLSAEELSAIEAEFRGANSKARILIQTKLKELGLYAGGVDGRFGPATMTGLVDFAQMLRRRDESLTFSSSTNVRELFDSLILGHF